MPRSDQDRITRRRSMRPAKGPVKRKGGPKSKHKSMKRPGNRN